jgi:iron(III) transport system substrate-binding protein
MGSRIAVLRRSGLYLIALCLASGFVISPSRALTPAEQLYAELAKLDDTERAKRIEEGAKKEGTFALVSGVGGEIGRNHTRLFEKRYPFLKVERTERGAEDAADLFVMEQSAGRHLTDVYTFSVASAGEVIRQNLSARYPTPVQKKVLSQYHGFLDPEHRWIPWMWSEHGISYNSSMLKPDEAPKGWFDLCEPRFKGTVSFDPLELRFLAGLSVMMGEDKLKSWLECMGKNKPIIMRGHTTRLNLMLAGDHAVQGDNYFYEGVNAQRKRNAPFAMVLTAPVIGYANGLYINKDAPHPHAAALYIDWSLGEESQAYVASVLRNPITQKSPFLPENANVVTFSYPDDAQKARLEKYWSDNIGAQ